jgi:ankyrin repeat protein
MVVASRPLRVEELAEFLAFKSETRGTLTFEGGWRPENPRDMVLSTCSSLVAIVNVEGSPVMQFSHFSVKEYLTSTRIAEGRASRYYISLEPAHIFVTQACLSLLLQLDNHVTKKSIEGFQLSRYAGQYWADHAELGTASSHTEDMIKRVFNPEYHHFANWVWVYDTILDRFLGPEVPSRPMRTPLHYAARHGLHRVAEWLITTYSQYVNVSNYDSLSSLLIIFREGRSTAVPVLLTHHADVNARDQDHWTPLHFASWYGHPRVARLLLEQGAVVNSKTKFGVTPLSLLSEKNGNLEVAQLLLEHGADPNSRSRSGCNSLYMALEKGHLDLLQLLLKHGADADAQDVDGNTLLHVISRHGNLKVAQGLLDLGVDINLRNNQGQTPLQVALQKGNEQVAELLLQHGAK